MLNQQNVKTEVLEAIKSFYPDMKDVTIYTEICVDLDAPDSLEDDRGGFEFTGYTRAHQIEREQGGLPVILLHAVHILAATIYMTWQSWSRPSAIVVTEALVWEDMVDHSVYYHVDVAWPLSAERTGPKFIVPPSRPGGN